MAGFTVEIPIPVIEVDTSDLKYEIARLKSVMTEQQFVNAMSGIMRQTGKHVKTTLKKTLPEEYYVKPGEINSATGAPRVSFGGSSAGCSISITGRRRAIGGKHIHATGSLPGWATLRRPPYKITAKIVKAGESVLPWDMDKTGNKPFRNSRAPRLNGVAFYRTSKARYPIQKVVGIAVPQMPMNRSKPEVQAEIKRYLENRMEHRLMALLANGR